MGIYTDLATGSGSITPTKPRVGLDRASGEQLLQKAAQHDPDVAAAYAAANEVTVIPEQTDAGAADTYTLTITFFGALAGTAVTTAAIAYNAVDTVIESAIDTAASGLPSWTNSDISVSMAGAAGLDDGTVTLTFDGTSVANTPAVVTLTPTGFNATAGISRSSFGSGDRKAVNAMYDLNVIEGPLWGAGETPVLTRPASNGQSRPRFQLIRDLAIEAAVEEGSDAVYDAVTALYPVV